MARLVDLFIRLLADDAGFQADVVKKAQTAGDAAGQTMGQRLGNGLKAGVKVGLLGVGAVAATAFGLGTKGLLELDTAMGAFRAETGATEEDVKSASDAVLEFSKNNLQPIAEIASTMAGLRTEMGLTQDEAEGLTEPFLKFAEVTGQTGPDAVSNFDDILDAWNLTADDSQGIMDKLIASHQQYGGSVVGNQEALTAMAPALQAANMDVDDGIGLLNMAAAAGIDASVASTAYTKALSKVESPEELQQLIDDIRNTEDPFKRAELAADLFGVKAGPKMAQLLAPGGQSLEDFQISTEEAAGATEDAAAAFEGTFGNQAKLWLKNITGMATGLVQNLGPGIGGVAVAAPLLGGALKPLFNLMKSGATSAIPLLFGALKTGVLNIPTAMGYLDLFAGKLKSIASGAIPLLVKGLGLIGPALTMATGPIGIIIAAVVALFVAWQTNFLGIRDIVGNVIDWLVENVVPIIKGIFDGVVAVVSTAVGTVTGVIGSIVGFVQGVLDFLVANVLPVISSIFDGVVAVVGTAIDVVVAIFKVWLAAWTTIIGAVVTVVSTAIGVIVAVIEAIVGVVEGVVDGVQIAMDIFMGIFDAVAGAIGGVVDLILAPIKAITGIVDGVADAIGGFFDWVTGGTAKAQQDLINVQKHVPNASPNLPGPGGHHPKGGPAPSSAPPPKVGGKPLPQFAQGAWSTPRGPAFLHAGEMVVPRPAADFWRRFARGLQPMQPARVVNNNTYLNVEGQRPVVSSAVEIAEHAARLGRFKG